MPQRRRRPLPEPFGLARLLRLGVAASVPAVWYEIVVLHLRGSFQSRPMWVPVLTLPAVLVAGGVSSVLRDEHRSRELFRPAAWFMALLGVIGTVFHLRGVRRQMGGFRNLRYNVVTGPPFPAPAQVALFGLLGGIASERLRRGEENRLVTWARAVNIGSYVLLATEAGYSHWQAGFFNRVMFVPLLVSPVLGLVHAGALAGSRAAKALEGPLSLLAAAAGLVGFAFHARNVRDRPGGPFWQGLFYGAPLVAPLQLSAQGVLGVITAVFDQRR